MELNRKFVITLVSPDGNTSITIPDEQGTSGIIADTLNLHELICDREFEIGHLFANKLEVEIYGLSQDVSGYWITLTDTYNSAYRTLCWFKGIVDSTELQPRTTERKLIAYDYSYTVRNLDVTDWWIDFWSTRTRASVKLVRDTLCSYVNLPVTQHQATLINDDVVFGMQGVVIPTFDKITFGNLLKMLCELQGCCPNVNRQGYMEFIPMSAYTTSDAVNITDNFMHGDTTIDDKEISAINGFTVVTDSSEIIIPVGATNAYTIEDNTILNQQPTSVIYDLMNPITTYLQNVRYTSASINLIISDYSIILGKLLTVAEPRSYGNDLRQRVTYHFVLNQTYSGSILVDQLINSVAFGNKLRGYSTFMTDPIPVQDTPSGEEY